MEDKIKIIRKIQRWSLGLLLLSIFIQPFFEPVTYISMGLSCVLYISILINNRLKNGKHDLILIILCSFALLYVFARQYITSPYVNIMGMLVLYGFLIRSFKLATGKWNKFIFIYGGISLVVALLDIYTNIPYLHWVVLGLQLVVVFVFLDPILEALGQAKRRQRLALEAEQKRIALENTKKEDAIKEPIDNTITTEYVENDDVTQN